MWTLLEGRQIALQPATGNVGMMLRRPYPGCGCLRAEEAGCQEGAGRLRARAYSGGGRRLHGRVARADVGARAAGGPARVPGAGYAALLAPPGLLRLGICSHKI